MALVNPAQDDTMADINITPFTDVLLVLLIIFMVSATAAVQSFRVNLPAAMSAQQAEKQTVAVALTDDGSLLVDQRKVDDADLGAALRQLKDEKKTDKLLVLADRKVPYERIVVVMDEGKKAGFTSIGLAARPKQP
jgi:biopolymer transport protein ExbD